MPADALDQVSFARELTPAERAAQLETFCREVDREQFRDTARTLGLCALYCIGGVYGLAWSVASTDMRIAPVVFWATLTVANTGISLTLIGAYLRALERNGES